MDIETHAFQLQAGLLRQLSGSTAEQVATLRELVRILTETINHWED